MSEPPDSAEAPQDRAIAANHSPYAAAPAASAWVVTWASAIKPGGYILDLACGSGRHARWLAERGFRVLAVDIDLSRFDPVPGAVLTMQADLEDDPWPFHDQKFDSIVVTNYLHRPRFELLLASIEKGGLLIYETFALGNERFGKPSNPDFLLQPGELRRRVGPAFEILGFEEGEVASPKPAVTQRICARRRTG